MVLYADSLVSDLRRNLDSIDSTNHTCFVAKKLIHLKLWSESPSEIFNCPPLCVKQGKMGAGRAMSTPSLPAEQAASAHIAASSSRAILNTGRIPSCKLLFSLNLYTRTKQACSPSPATANREPQIHIGHSSFRNMS